MLIAQQTLLAVQTPEILLFLGRFHPLVVHLPIGFLVLAAIMEWLARQKAYAYLKPAIPFTLAMGFFGALTAAAVGFLLSLDDGYESDALGLHQWAGIGLVVASGVTLWLKQMPQAPGAYRVSLMLTLGLLGLAGHAGGNLTHGSDYLTKYLPQPIKQLTGMAPNSPERIPPASLADALAFEDLVQPVFEARCISCHNAQKSKGGLRLDTEAHIVKGGHYGPLFNPETPHESLLADVLELPLDNEYHMPPKGKTQLTKAQIALVKWWVAQGAPFGKTVSELNLPPSDYAKLVELTGLGLSKNPSVFDQPVGQPDPEALKQLATLGFWTMPVAKASHFLEVRYRNPEQPIAQKSTDMLLRIAENVVWLDLSEAVKPDTLLFQLANFPHLQKINLKKSGVQDQHLQQLGAMPYLELLNLYETAISDQGLVTLNLPQLRSLFVWGTKVTPNGLHTLQEKSRNLQIAATPSS
jgi:uncharacterized membrane protein/mono/diheme cytochrome c family protein